MNVIVPARTLREILSDEIVAAANQRNPLLPLIDKVQPSWTADLFQRKPAPAYIEGEDGVVIYQGTDLDLFSVGMAWSQRRAVINIPEYDKAKVTSLSSNHYVIANENRHGQVARLVGTKDTHAFSAMIVDFNVVEIKPDGKEEVGFPRNFWIVNDGGDFYEGWRRFEWHSTPEEDQFIADRRLEAYNSTIEFQYFVHPALATAIYGRRYLRNKRLADRVEDEASYYRGIAKKLIDQGVTLPEHKPAYAKEGERETIQVRTLETKLLMPEFQGSYPLRGTDNVEKGDLSNVIDYDTDVIPDNLIDKQRILRYSLWWANQLSFKYGQIVRAPVRAVELAFFLYGLRDKTPGTEVKPGWSVPQWQRDYKEEKPRARIKWNMLELNPHVKLMYRIRKTATERRAA